VRERGRAGGAGTGGGGGWEGGEVQTTSFRKQKVMIQLP